MKLIFVVLLASYVALTTAPSWAQTVATDSQATAQTASQAAVIIGGGGGTPAIGSSLNYRVDSTTYANPVDLGDTVPNLWVPGPGGGGTNPCIVSVGAGAVGSGFGFGFSRGYNDEECQVRETLRIMAAQMNPESPQADRVMKNIACQSKIVRAAMRESGLRCANDSAPRARRTRSTSTLSTSAPRPAATSGKAAAYAACRKVSDSEFSNCMRKARNS